MTRCRTFSTIPRTEGVSSRSTTCCMRRNPRPRTVARISRVQPMALRTHFSLTVPAFFFAMFASRFLAQLFHSFEALLGHPAFVFQTQKRIEGGLDDVMRIRC